MEPLLTPQEVADCLGLPKSTLYQWHHRNSGPPVLKVGRHLRYRASDVESWLTERGSEAAA